MLEILSAFVIHLIQTTNYFGIFVLMALTTFGIPIPSEITLPFSGFLANKGSLNLELVILVGVLGDLAGALVGYGIGYFLEETFLLGLIKRYGKFILLTEDDYTKTTGWMKKYGSPVVFVGKLIPGVKSFVSIAAGLSEIKLHKFILSNLAGALVYVSIITYFGYYLGSKWGILGGYFRKSELVIVIIAIVGLAWYINHKLKLIKLPKII